MIIYRDVGVERMTEKRRKILRGRKRFTHTESDIDILQWTNLPLCWGQMKRWILLSKRAWYNNLVMRWFISLTLRHCATSYSDTMVSSSKHYPKSIDRNKYTKVWITSQTTLSISTQAKRGWKNSASTFPKKESKACQMPKSSSNLSQPPWNANVLTKLFFHRA